MRKSFLILAVACLVLTFASVAFAAAEIALQNNFTESLNLFVDGQYAVGPVMPGGFDRATVAPGSHLLEARTGMSADTTVRTATIDLKDHESRTWIICVPDPKTGRCPGY